MSSLFHPVFPLLLLLLHLSTYVHVHKFSVCWGPPTSIYSLSRRYLPILSQYQLSIARTCQIFKRFWTYLVVLFCDLIFISFTSWFPNCDTDSLKAVYWVCLGLRNFQQASFRTNSKNTSSMKTHPSSTVRFIVYHFFSMNFEIGTEKACCFF